MSDCVLGRRALHHWKYRIQAFAGNVENLARDVACVANAGIGGCGFEQPLDAALKALLTSNSAVRFVQNTVGHGDGLNAGFVRDNSILAIVLLSDENDCSALDVDLFNFNSVAYGGTDLRLRCSAHPEALQPTQRFVAGLLELKSDPADVVFAQITGIPPDLLINSTDPDFDTILADPRMLETVDPMTQTQLISSCSSAANGLAYPPTRPVKSAQLLLEAGGNIMLGSVCQDTYSLFFQDFVVLLGTLNKLREPIIFVNGFEFE